MAVHTTNAPQVFTFVPDTPSSPLSSPETSTQTFRLIWLDANNDDSNQKDIQHTINELRFVSNTICKFTQPDECIAFLNTIDRDKVLMIVSGSYGKIVVPQIHSLSQITSIFVFCGDRARHESWANRWGKVKGVFTDIRSICELLKEAAQQFVHDAIPMSFIPQIDDAAPESIDQLDKSFMYTQILKDILLEIPFEKHMLRDFVAYCRREFAENQRELDNVNRFERKYQSHTPIWWYTCECFLYPMLNRALRTMEVETIINLGFFVGDLHRQIAKLHKKQYERSKSKAPFTVYRGQGLPRVEFDRLVRSTGGLLSFNNFLSSSKKSIVAMAYARRVLTDTDSVGVVFEMLIDPNIQSTPFADVHKYGFFKGVEQEILFSMHTVFRIGEITPADDSSNRIFRVHLILTSDHDQQLTALTERMREELQGTQGWYRLGQLMMQLDKFEKAEELYRALLKKESKESERSNIYYQLGWARYSMGDYHGALTFYHKSREIDAKINNMDDPHIAILCDSFGLVYSALGDYNKALKYHERALEIYRTSSVPKCSHTAICLNNIGMVYYRLQQYDDAQHAHQEALEIYKETLPENHPHLAASYNNLGLVHDQMSDPAQALQFYKKGLEIHMKILPPTHRHVAISHQNIGKAYEKMGEYVQALKFHQKALDIFERTLPPNHPIMANCHFYIGKTYQSSEQYLKALSYYEKALQIRTKALPKNHPDVINMYNTIGTVYEGLGDYSKSLEYFEKALDINRDFFSPNSNQLANSYHHVARVSNRMNDHQKALMLAISAVTIGQQTLKPNHPDLLEYRATLERMQQMF